MKKYIIFFVIVAINIPHNTEIFAKPVDIETAKTLGSNFLKQPVTEAKTGNAFQSYNPPYYIFNVENNNGWVIVAGDDVMPAVLAYSNEGSWNADNIAPSAYFMLEMYEATFNNVDEFATQNEQWNDLLNTSKKQNCLQAQVEPLITTRWGKGILIIIIVLQMNRELKQWLDALLLQWHK